jgi:1-acyl-sn-glycerol-3-phosphate acyltransferase
MAHPFYLTSALKLGLIALSVIVAAPWIIVAGLWDRDGRLAYRLCRLWLTSLLKIGRVKVKVRGLDHLRRDHTYIFIANHQSHYDVPVLSFALKGFQIRWTAKRELARIPVFGWGLRASRHILVNRGNAVAAVQILAKAREKLRAGISLAFFPEGSRSMNGKLGPFKRGGFRLAVETRTPIVPITINGTGKVLRKSQWSIHGGEVEVVISAPILPNGDGRGQEEALLQAAKGCVERHYLG